MAYPVFIHVDVYHDIIQMLDIHIDHKHDIFLYHLLSYA